MEYKNCLITGGSSGIGLETVKKLASTKKWKIISLSRNKKRIEKAKERLKELNQYVEFYSVDISNFEEISTTVKEKLNREFKKIDCLINCAGIINTGGIEDLSLEEWQEMLDVNLTAMYLLIKTVLPLFKPSGKSSIINISSVSSTKPSPTSIGYSVSKAGVDMLSKCLANDLNKYNIKVNSINPGLIETEFQINNSVMNSKEYTEFLKRTDKIGKTKDISNLILFLIDNDWINGENIVVDGGKSLI